MTLGQSLSMIPRRSEVGGGGGGVANLVLQHQSAIYGSGNVFGNDRSVYHNSTLFYCNGAVVFALDVSDPSSPVELSSLSIGELVGSMAAKDDTLFVIAESGVVYSVGISDPEAIAIDATFDPAFGGEFQGWAWAVIDGNFLYTNGHFPGGGDAGSIVCYGISNPTAVSLVARARHPFGSWGGGGLAVIGTTLWAADYFSKYVNGTAVFHSLDISTPSAMAVTGTFDATDAFDTAFETWGMCAIGNTLYILDDWIIQAWNVSTPASPALASDIDASSNSGADTEGFCIAPSINTLFNGINGGHSINVYDLTSPNAPAFLDNFPQAGGVSRISDNAETERLLFGCVGGMLAIWSY